jgi:hypothetical protein
LSVGPAERESSDQQRASTKSLALARRCVRVVDAKREEPLTKAIHDDGSMSVLQVQFWVSSQGWESYCRHLTGCSSGIKANTETLADMERWWVENPGTSTTTLCPLRRSPPNRNHPLSQLWQGLCTLLQDSLLLAIASIGAKHTIDNVFAHAQVLYRCQLFRSLFQDLGSVTTAACGLACRHHHPLLSLVNGHSWEVLFSRLCVGGPGSDKPQTLT